jgi:hypothetical protein
MVDVDDDEINDEKATRHKRHILSGTISVHTEQESFSLLAIDKTKTTGVHILAPWSLQSFDVPVIITNIGRDQQREKD